MNQALHSKIVSFIWDVADDVLRDLKSRGSQQLSPAGIDSHLCGQEISPKPRVFFKADVLLEDDQRWVYGTPLSAGKGFSHAISVHQRQAV